MRYDAGGMWIEFPFSEQYIGLIRGTQYVKPDGVGPATPEVTPEVRFLQAMTEPRSRRALRTSVGLRDDEHFRKTYLLPALNEGLIEMTIPDKPTSRLQKYQLTETGQMRLRVLSNSQRDQRKVR